MRQAENDRCHTEHSNGSEHGAPRMSLQGMAGKKERGSECAHGGRRAQKAEAPRAGEKDVAGVDRQQGSGAPEENRKEIERDRAEQLALTAYVSDAREHRCER